MAERIFGCVKCRWPGAFLARNRDTSPAESMGPAEMRFCGPEQRRNGCARQDEHLHVTCPRCGWIHTVPCADALPGVQPAADATSSSIRP
jgi:hypothetical protein